MVGSSRIASRPEPGTSGKPGRGHFSILASGVWMVSVKLVTAPPGGRLDGLSDAVAPNGTPCTASAIGLDRAAPVVATEKLYVAALPAGTACVAEPVAVKLKSDAAPTTTFALPEVLGRKFESPE